MKAILAFDLPEDTLEFTLASNAGMLLGALAEADSILRAEKKHGPCSIASLQKAIDEARAAISEAMERVGP